MVDTSLFDLEFKAKLLNTISDLDEQTDGVIFHSDNFQALNLMQEKYREQVQCIYIDPPYNTDASAIIYKNGYKHSSWLALLNDRVSISSDLLSESGLISIAIDEEEAPFLNNMISDRLGRRNLVCNFAIMNNPKGRDAGFVAMAHEYMLSFAKSIDYAKTYSFKLTESASQKKYSRVNEEGVSYRELPLKRTGTGKLRTDRPYMFFPFFFRNRDKALVLPTDEEYINIYNREEGRFNDDYLKKIIREYENKGYRTILPRDNDGVFLRWRWGFETCKKGVLEGSIIAKEDNINTVFQIDEASNTVKPKSLWYGERYDSSSKGTNLLNSILKDNLFDYPKVYIKS